MTTTQHIKLLGALSIEENGFPATVMKYRKGSALLAYLIITQQTHDREAIADLLWDASSTTQSLRNLRKLLHQLRPLVPELHVTRKQLAYQANPEIEIDFYKLTEVLAERNMATLEAVLPIYTGDLLAGFYLDGAPRFNEWLLLERERWRQLVWDGYSQFCTALQEQQEWGKGIEAARRWLRLDPLDEKIQQRLITFLTADGQIDAALAQYETYQQELWQELGVEPEPETVALAQHLTTLKSDTRANKNWNAVLEPPFKWPEPDQLAEPSSLPSNACVPYQRNAYFIGRKDSLLGLAALLRPKASGSQRAVAITGMGGLGKTQLATEFAYRYGRYFSGGVFWMSFANPANILEEVATIGGERGLGLYKEAEQLTLTEQVARVKKAWQEPTDRLLIFDNCEEEALLEQWLPVTGGCRVLLTSRRATWSRELQVATWPLPLLNQDESVSLLQQLSPRTDVSEAAEIAEEVGHLPLALHLAGGFLQRYQQVTAADYIKQLQAIDLLQHPSLKGRGTNYSPTGHELNVARTYALNFDKLNLVNEVNVQAKRLLSHATCFAPGEPIPKEILLKTIHQDDGDLETLLLAQDALNRLLSLGFLEVKEEEMVVIHRLLVEFTNQAVQEEQGDSAFATARDHVERTLVNVLSMISSYSNTFGVSAMPLASTHLHMVTNQAFARKSQWAVSLGNFWASHLRDTGEFHGARDYFEQTIALSESLLSTTHPKTAETLNNLGLLFFEWGSYEQATECFQKARDIWEQSLGADRPETAESLDNLGIVAGYLGRFDESYDYLTQALSIQEKALGPTHPLLINRLGNVGALLTHMGKFEDANLYLHRSLELVRQEYGDNHASVAVQLYYLGQMYTGTRNYTKAHEFLNEALSILESNVGENNRRTAVALHWLGVLHMHLGDRHAARVYLERALTVQEKILRPNHPHTARTRSSLGRLLIDAGTFEQAHQQLTDALIVEEGLYGQFHVLTAFTLQGLGRLHTRQKQFKQAYTFIEKALQIYKNAVEADHLWLADSQIEMGQLLLAMGQLEEARPYLERAFAIREQKLGADHIEVARLLIILSEWYYANKEDMKAHALFEQAQVVLETNTFSARHSVAKTNDTLSNREL